jgi:hypothetical protein
MQGLHRYQIRQYEFIFILIVQEDIAVQQARYPRLRGYHRAVWSLRPVEPAARDSLFSSHHDYFLLLLPLHVL